MNMRQSPLKVTFNPRFSAEEPYSRPVTSHFGGAEESKQQPIRHQKSPSQVLQDAVNTTSIDYSRSSPLRASFGGGPDAINHSAIIPQVDNSFTLSNQLTMNGPQKKQ